MVPCAEGLFDQIRDDDNAHIFINSIPNQLLSKEDWQMLEDLYGDRLSRIVMEITENARSEIEIDAKKGHSAGNGIFRLPLTTLVLATATVTCWSHGCSTM